MRVEVTEKKLRDTDPDTEVRYDLVEGDTLTVPDKLGTAWCSRGWAKDVAGVVPTGERIEGPAKLEVQPGKGKTAAAVR